MNSAGKVKYDASDWNPIRKIADAYVSALYPILTSSDLWGENTTVVRILKKRQKNKEK